MASLIAIVLAGGQSSRMGQDKALILVNGVPMLRRVCETALTCAETVYVVTAWGDRYREILPDRCQIVPELPLPHETAPHGPLVAFAEALSQIPAGTWVLLLACDLPRLDAKLLQQQAAHLSQLPDSVDMLLARNPRGWWEPLCGFYHHRCLPSLIAFVEQGGRSFQDWLAHEAVQELPLPSESLFNCNTPADIANLGSEF